MASHTSSFFTRINIIFILIFSVQLSTGFWLWGDNDKGKVDGKWSSWSNYSTCKITNDKSAGLPYRVKTRNCNNPAPKAGGKPCQGQSLRKAPCSNCEWPLGIESKVIEDSMISASSFHKEFPAKNARLNGPSSWCAGVLTGELYLQVDFKSLTLVTAIATQGFYPDPKELSLRLGSVSKYQITYSDDGIVYEVYENSQKNKVFIGNGNNKNTIFHTFDPNIAAKYIRIHPTAYIKFVCMKFELYGCSFKCGGYLPASPGDLLAVSSETEDIDCFWQAHAPNSSKINFDFINFNIPCKYGQVEVRGDDPYYGGSKILGKYCDNEFAPPPIASKWNKLYIRFQSSSSNPLIGFYGIYFPSCDAVLNSTQGMFSSPRYPQQYNHNSKCTWNIFVPNGKIVKLEFLDFDIEEHTACKNDYLSIYDSNSSAIGQYCNSNKPPRFVCSSSNSMRLHFKSDDVLALKGFKASYKAINADQPCIDQSSSTISPTPTIVFSTSMVTNSSMVYPTIVPTPSAVFPSATINSSLGVMVMGNGVPGVPGNQLHTEGDDDDEDNGLTTIIIISVFSFIVLCMIIASVIPSMIHGYEKRKREREWMAAADLAVKKSGVMPNEYEMQPVKPQDKNKNKDLEPSETTAFLDPNNSSNQSEVSPCIEDIDTVENHTDGPPDEDPDCDLEYDTTDLNLSVSYEDLGSSFATEMAALMSNYNTGNKDKSTEPQQDKHHAVNDNDKNNKASNEPSEQQKPTSKEMEDNYISKENDINKEPQELNKSNDKLQNALIGLKATLSDPNSDSSSIPEIENPDICSNSTVSVANSQEIPSIPKEQNHNQRNEDCVEVTVDDPNGFVHDSSDETCV